MLQSKLFNSLHRALNVARPKDSVFTGFLSEIHKTGVMCNAAATAAVERIFSIAGFIIRGRRSYLSDSTFEFLLFNNIQCKSRGVYEL